jgi:hypothetical protein
MEDCMDRQYKFVGGPQDGREVSVGGRVSLGTEIPATIAREDRTAVYVFGDDGCFHFSRFGPPPLTNWEPHDEDTQRLTEIMQRLASALTDLDSFYQAQGGYPNQTQVGTWVLTKTVGVK